MTAARQPGLAARGLYTGVPGGVRDPQTTQEQGTLPERIAMSGVQADGADHPGRRLPELPHPPEQLCRAIVVPRLARLHQ